MLRVRTDDSPFCPYRLPLKLLVDPESGVAREVARSCGTRKCRFCLGQVALYDSLRYSLAIVDSALSWYEFEIPRPKLKAALEYVRSKNGMALAIPLTPPGETDDQVLLWTTHFSPTLRRRYGLLGPDGTRQSLSLSEIVAATGVGLDEYLEQTFLRIPPDRHLHPSDALRHLRDEIAGTDLTGSVPSAPAQEISPLSRRRPPRSGSCQEGVRSIPIIDAALYLKAKKAKEFEVDPLAGWVEGVPPLGSVDWVIKALRWGLDLEVAYTPEQYAVHLSTLEARERGMVRRVALAS